MAARLCIPVLSDAEQWSEVVVVPVQQLPDEPEDLLEILASEAAPLSTWFDFARAYLAEGKEDAFRDICLEGTKEETVKEVERFFGKRPIYEQVQFHCGLAALQIGKAKDEKDRQKKSELFAGAAQHLQSAKLLDPEEQLVSLGFAMLHMAKGEMAAVKQELMRTMELKNNGKTNIVGYLALAHLLFGQKQYKEALALYRRAVLEHPTCPAEVRLGIAACQYRLGNMVDAGAAFERVIALDPTNPDAHLGLAAIKFSSANVQQGLADGLKLLVKAYELDPTHVGTLVLLAHYCLLRGEYDKVLVLARSAMEAADSDAVRGECMCMLARAHHALGAYDQAKQSYQQAVRLDPSAPLPHLGMAQMFLSSASGTAAMSGAINASTELETAVKAAPAFYDALKVLGALIRGNRDKTGKVLGQVRTAATRAEDDADIWELLGELSAANDPAGSLAAYRKALALHRGKQQEARKRAEEDATRRAEQRAARKAAASQSAGLFGSDDDEDDADDVGIMTQVDVAAAAHRIPARLLNNAAVLLYRSGEHGEARKLIEEATVEANAHGDDLAPAHRTALAYNLARLQEAGGELSEATRTYEEILAVQPDYIDCYLRLACVARAKGAIATALDWARQALSRAGGHSDALALISQLHMERREYPQAEAAIKQLQKATAAAQDGRGAGPARDIYGQLAMGNLLLASIPTDRRKEEASRRAEKQLLSALDQYRMVLKADPANAWAANGVGAVLAELGRLDEAGEVFSDVQAAAAASGGFLHIPDLYVNLANCALAKQEYASALRLYRLAADKLDAGKRAHLLLYLARANYDCDELPTARAHLLRAIHVFPTNYPLRFNVALTMQEWAVRAYRKQRPAGDPTRLPEYERAQSELEQAVKFFESLASLPPERTKLDPNKLTAHIKFCKDQLNNAGSHISAAQREAEALAEQRQNAERLRELADQRRQVEAMRREALERAEREAQEARAKEALDKQERLKGEWRLKREAEPLEGAEGGEGGGKKKKKASGGGKKKKGVRGMAQDAEEPTDEGEDEPKPEGVQAGGDGLPDNEDLFGSDSDDDAEDAAREKEMLAKAGLDSDDDDEELGGLVGALEDDLGDADAGGGGGARRHKRIRAAALDDDDEGAQQGGDTGLEDADDEGGAAGDQPAKRARRAAALAESDDDEGVGAGAGGGDAGGGSPPGGQEAPAGGEPAVDALFGEDDE